MHEKLTMTSICDGAVQEKVDRALRAVADNILDPNTDPKKKRSITMKIVFQPNENDREDVAVHVEVTKSLAPEAGVKTQLFIAKDIESGALTVQEHQKGMIKGQLDFGDLADLYGELDEEGGESEFDPEEGLETVPYGDVLDFQRAQGER